jgi:hypothetical protein
VTDAQIPTAITRDSEVPGLIGSVVRSITPSGGTSLTNDIVLDGAGSIDIQQSGNTITIVGTTGTAAATDVACTTPCVSSAEISGTLTDAHVPATIARDTEVAGAIATHATANDAHGLSSFTTGTLAETRIDAAIARDTEVAGAIAVHVASLAASYSHQSSNQPAVAGVSTLGVSCPVGTQVLGGGVQNSVQTITMLGSWPSASNSWSVSVNNSGADAAVTVYAVCASIQ